MIHNLNNWARSQYEQKPNMSVRSGHCDHSLCNQSNLIKSFRKIPICSDKISLQAVLCDIYEARIKVGKDGRNNLKTQCIGWTLVWGCTLHLKQIVVKIQKENLDSRCQEQQSHLVPEGAVNRLCPELDYRVLPGKRGGVSNPIRESWGVKRELQGWLKSL